MRRAFGRSIFVQRCRDGAARTMAAPEGRDRSRAFGATPDGTCWRQSRPLVFLEEATKLSVLASDSALCLTHLTLLSSGEPHNGRSLRGPTRAHRWSGSLPPSRQSPPPPECQQGQVQARRCSGRQLEGGADSAVDLRRSRVCSIVVRLCVARSPTPLTGFPSAFAIRPRWSVHVSVTRHPVAVGWSS